MTCWFLTGRAVHRGGTTCGTKLDPQTSAPRPHVPCTSLGRAEDRVLAWAPTRDAPFLSHSRRIFRRARPCVVAFRGPHLRVRVRVPWLVRARGVSQPWIGLCCVRGVQLWLVGWGRQTGGGVPNRWRRMRTSMRTTVAPWTPPWTAAARATEGNGSSSWRTGIAWRTETRWDGAGRTRRGVPARLLRHLHVPSTRLGRRPRISIARFRPWNPTGAFSCTSVRTKSTWWRSKAPWRVPRPRGTVALRRFGPAHLLRRRWRWRWRDAWCP